MRSCIAHFLPSIICILLVNATWSGAAADIRTSSTSSFDDAARTKLAVDQFIRTQLPGGLFPYDYDFATGAAADMNDISGINIVRQAGASFALSEYLVDFDSAPLRKTIATALRTFEERSLPIGKGIAQSALEHLGVYNQWRYWMSWREPLNTMGLLYSPAGDGAVVAANGRYERAWSGATALALIVELKYRAATGDERFADARMRWLRGLIALRVPGRGFREAPHYLTESGYVNGEAWLAIAEYSRAFPENKEIAKLLAKLDDYLIERYRKNPALQFYSWGTMASAVRAETTSDPRFLAFTREQTAWVLSTEERLLDDPENSCAWIEGLATAYHMLQHNPDEAGTLLSTMRKWITVMMEHNRDMQLLPQMSQIKLADGSNVTSPRLEDFAGAFLMSTTSPKTQVDVTGHCLSALVRMHRAGLTLR